jgi:rhodanese-related sulfurtransferase
LAHGARISLGAVELEIRHTPGHTPESLSVVVRENPDADPWGVLTGDTLFIGDVGRPDLLAAAGCSAEELAGDLYRSLHDQLLTLPDSTRVYPAHGAGSACGKHLSTASSSTIGEQRNTNYALAPMSETEFVQRVTEGQRAAPLYFSFAANVNRSAHALLDDEPPMALDLTSVLDAVADGAVLLDTRSPEQFAAGHLAGAVNVGLEGRFAEYAGDVVRSGQPIVLVADPDAAQEAKMRLGRIGFDVVIGALHDLPIVLEARPELARRATRLDAHAFEHWRRNEDERQIVDVREAGERLGGVVPDALPIPLGRILEWMSALDPHVPTVVYCAGGYRSSIAASLLRARGFTDVSDVLGGYGAWRHFTQTTNERTSP